MSDYLIDDGMEVTLHFTLKLEDGSGGGLHQGKNTGHFPIRRRQPAAGLRASDQGA